MSTTAGRAGLLAVATAVAALLALGAIPVLAHAELAASDPPDGARLEVPPSTIELTFTEGLNAGRSSIRLNHAGETLATGRPAQEGARVMRLDGLDLAPGAYGIRWTAAAADGHIERGTVRFTVLEPTPTPEPTATPTATPAATAPPAASPSGNDTGSPSPTAVPTPPSSASPAGPSPEPSPDPAPAASSGGDVLIPILAGVLLVAGVGAYVLRRSRVA